jgi:hypothetical protein
MKKLLRILLACIGPCLLLAQKHDYIWIAGRQNFPNITTHGGMVIDFKQKPVSVYYNYRNINMFVCNASICDTAGNLIAYSNGCEIGGADDQIIENGEEINPGYLHQLRCVQYDDGYGSGIQSAVFLPTPQDDSMYYLFHKQIRTFSNNTLSGFTEKLLYSIVNQRFNNGLGKVTAKNVEIIKDTLSYGELITIKHSNGKDWWIITPRRNNNAFYILKFTKDGIVDTFTQKIGIKASIPGEGYGQVVFSPDGTKLYRTNPFNPIMVYPILVTAAIIKNKGKYLITQRPKDKHNGLRWEFPGGKLNFGEEPRECLEREIQEELGIKIKAKERREHQPKHKTSRFFCFDWSYIDQI